MNQTPYFKPPSQISQFNEVMRQMNTVIAEFKRQTDDYFLPALAQIKETMRQLPNDIEEVVYALADRGWYFSSDMDIPFLREIQSALRLNNERLVDDLFQARITSEVTNIAGRAIKRFPHRAFIIQEAINAHLSEQYALSIPVLLVQLEGMCQDEFKIKFFSVNRGVPKISEFVESMSDGSFTDAFLLPLKKPSGLTASAEYRSNYPNSLNRHEIIHGTDTSYPSLQNSLKALSLLDYFVTLVIEKDDE